MLDTESVSNRERLRGALSASARRRFAPVRAACFAVALTVAVLMLLPIYWMLKTAISLDPPSILVPSFILWPRHVDWGIFARVAGTAQFWTTVGNSFTITLPAMVGDVCSAAVVGFAFARLRAPGARLLFLVVLGTLMIPFEVTFLPQVVLFSYLGWLNTFLPLIVPPFFGNALYIFLVRQFMRTIPRDLDDAALIDGAGYWVLFWRIILPLSTPALAAVAAFSFVAHWNDLFGPLIYLDDESKYPLTYAMAWLGGSPWTMALALMSAVPCLILFFTAQRYLLRGTVLSGLVS